MKTTEIKTIGALRDAINRADCVLVFPTFGRPARGEWVEITKGDARRYLQGLSANEACEATVNEADNLVTVYMG